MLHVTWDGGAPGPRSGEELEVLTAVVVVLLVVVALLLVVVTGLLRSHADIVRALHSLGVGVGDPAGEAGAQAPAPAAPVHLSAGPPLPGERSSSSAHDVAGVDPGGDAVVVSVGTEGRTLLAFLTSGCATCATFWSALSSAEARAALPADVRVVVVTKGPEWESPSAIAGKAARGLHVVMSTDAWTDYEVPGSPYFALVDGASRRRVGEGVANQWSQITDLVARAGRDAEAATTSGRAAAGGLSGPEREAATDAELAAAGVLPGDPSLYPGRIGAEPADAGRPAGP